jgi:hypothetical protein
MLLRRCHISAPQPVGRQGHCYPAVRGRRGNYQSKQELTRLEFELKAAPKDFAFSDSTRERSRFNGDLPLALPKTDVSKRPKPMKQRRGCCEDSWRRSRVAGQNRPRRYCGWCHSAQTERAYPTGREAVVRIAESNYDSRSCRHSHTHQLDQYSPTCIGCSVSIPRNRVPQ